MDDLKQLQHLARSAIQEGRVPLDRPARPWASSGDGSLCPICRTTISTQELAYELEFPGSASEIQVCAVHARCFRAWDFVRLEVASVPGEVTESPT